MFFRRTVGDALDYAWRAKWSRAKGAHKKAQLVKVVRAEVGTTYLGKLDYNALDEWIRRLQDADQAVATIKSKVSCLLTALKLVQPKGWIKQIPNVPPIGEPDNAKLRWLSEDEEKTLIAACKTQRRYVVAEVMEDVIAFLVDTGARVGELLKVRDDSLFRRGNVWCVEFLDRKSGDDLRVPLTSRAHTSIQRLLASRYWQKRVRGTRESAKRLASAQNWVTHRFGEVRTAAALPEVTAHTLRHTFCSRLVQRGVSLYVVSKLSGHADIRQTERYAHLAAAVFDTAIQVLETPPDNVIKLPRKSD